MKKILLIPALALLAGCTHLFFNPSGQVYADPAALGLKCEAIKFSAPDGTPLTGLYFPPEGRPLGTVVHFHGNAENMTSHFPFSAWLAKKGYNVFIFDYRGYGASGGKAALDGLVMDGEAALRQAQKLPGADPAKMVVFGQSLGGAIAMAAVGESGFKPAAMVLEGTFYSYRGVASGVLLRHWWAWPFSWLPWVAVSGAHAPKDYIASIGCPKVFIHSENDRTVPFSQGRKLYEAAAGPKEFWTVPYGHINAFTDLHAAYAPRLLNFLRKSLGN